MNYWITDADYIRDTLDKYGPLTREELSVKTNLERAPLTKSLYALKKQGDVIEEGDRLMLTKTPETEQDALEEVETGVGSTPAVESGTGQAGPVEMDGITADFDGFRRAYNSSNKTISFGPRPDNLWIGIRAKTRDGRTVKLDIAGNYVQCDWVWSHENFYTFADGRSYPNENNDIIEWEQPIKSGPVCGDGDAPTFGDSRTAYEAWAYRFPGTFGKESNNKLSARLQNSLDEMEVQVQRDLEETVNRIQDFDRNTVQYVHMPEKKPLTPEENEKLNEAIDLGLDARNAVSILSEAYWTAIGELSELRADNEQLRSKIAQTEDFSGKYIALKEKLRGMLDE